MPQRKSALQELKKSHTKHMHNLDIKTDLRKTVKKFMVAVEANTDEAKGMLPTVYKKMDKAAKRNIFSKNTAARRKSHFAKILGKTTASQ